MILAIAGTQYKTMAYDVILHANFRRQVRGTDVQEVPKRWTLADGRS